MRSITNEELLLIAGGDGEEFDEGEGGSTDEDSFGGEFDSPDGSKRKGRRNGGGTANEFQKIMKEKLQEDVAERASEAIVNKGIEWLGNGLDALGELGREMLDVAAKQPPVNPGKRSGRE
jgi:hypothetical protein